MGKGKQKGFRPGGAGASMLMGGAESCTGHAIASPVTLRQEGIAMPKDHMNYGGVFPDDDDKKGKGKGGKKGKTPDVAPTVPKSGVPAEPPPKPAEEPKPVEKPVEKPKPKVEMPPPSKPVARSAPIGHDGLSEIERRRKAMGAAAPVDDGLSEIERRRKAMAAAAPEPEPEEEEEEEEDTATDDAFRQRLAKAQAAREQKVQDEQGGGELKRDREELTDVKEEAPPAKKPVSQGGLQAWAERVNQSAGDDAEKARLCREWVRKRILKAHGAGDLHSNNWEEEPLPGEAELSALAVLMG